MSDSRWLKAIGTWQVFGGLVSAVMFLDSARGIPNGDRMALVLVAMAISGFCVLAGYALLRGNTAAYGPSLVVWLVQSIAVSIHAMAIQVSIGPYLYLGLTSTWVGLDGGFRPKLILQWGLAERPFILGVNLLALFAIALLFKLRRQRRMADVEAPSPAI